MIDNFIYEIKELALSHSSLTTYRHGCGRKFELGKLMQHPSWRGDGQNLPAAVGVALHVAYQEYLRTKSTDWALHTLAINYPWALNLQRDQNTRSIWASITALHLLLNHPHLLPYELAQIKDKNGELHNAVEVGFKFNTNLKVNPGGDRLVPVTYVGFIDAILFNKLTNSYLVLDVKTTRENINYDIRYRNDEQCLPYSFVVNHLTGQAVENFTVMYLVIYVDLLEPKFQLLDYEKTSNDVRRWAHNFVLTVQDIQEQMLYNTFPKHGPSCLAYKHPCRFFGKECDIHDRKFAQDLIQADDVYPIHQRPEPLIELDLELTE